MRVIKKKKDLADGGGACRLGGGTLLDVERDVTRRREFHERDVTRRREFKLPWREVGQPKNHHDDKVDSDQ